MKPEDKRNFKMMVKRKENDTVTIDYLFQPPTPYFELRRQFFIQTIFHAHPFFYVFPWSMMVVKKESFGNFHRSKIHRHDSPKRCIE